MAMTYAQWQTSITTLMGATDVTDPNYIAIEPSIIAYAEGRISRDLNLLGTITRNSTKVLTVDNRAFVLPSSPAVFDVIHAINLFVPAGTTPSTGGTRVLLTPVSRDFLDICWPNDTSAAATNVPKYFCMLTDQTILVGPSPGDTYTVEVVGYTTQTALSVSNPTTFLTLNLPDLFVAASMIFAAGYMKNYGAQADDPKMAMSWESQYRALLEGADTTEARRKFAGASWTSHQVEKNAIPQRG